jgi:hypothetical protein
MSYQTYTLIKDDELILETQAATVDRAIDYFAIDYPQIFSVKSGYSVGGINTNCFKKKKGTIKSLLFFYNIL